MCKSNRIEGLKANYLRVIVIGEGLRAANYDPKIDKGA